MEDVLIFERTQQEHDAQLHAALQKIESTRVALNKDKYEFSRDCLVFPLPRRSTPVGQGGICNSVWSEAFSQVLGWASARDPVLSKVRLQLQKGWKYTNEEAVKPYQH